jgi:hypothetical protein
MLILQLELFLQIQLKQKKIISIDNFGSIVNLLLPFNQGTASSEIQNHDL